MRWSRLRNGMYLGITAALLFGACGKKKSNSSSSSQPNSVDDAVTAATSSLELSAKLNLIPSEVGKSSTSLRLAGETDFSKDQSNFYVQDSTMEALEMASSILCFMDQTGYNNENLVNKGPFVAQADMAQCENKGGNSSSNGSSNEQEIVNVTVDSKRETNKALEVKFWFTMSHGEGDSQAIAGFMKVAEGSNATNPVGIFRAQFEMYEAAGSPPKRTANKTGNVVLESKREGTNGPIVVSITETNKSSKETWEMQAAARIKVENEEVTGGLASIRQKSNYDGKEEKKDYVLGFNDSKFLAVDQVKSAKVCKDLKSNFGLNVWRYGLYDAQTEAKVKSNSSMAIMAENANGKDPYGNAGYWGIWFRDIPVTSGLKVNAIKFTSGSAPEKGEAYTVVQGPGKLSKFSKKTLSASDLVGVGLNAFEGMNSFVVAWNGSKFQKVQTCSNSSNGTTCTNITPVDYALTANMSYNFYSQAFGGQVIVVTNASAGIKEASAFVMSDVTGSLANATALYCFDRCPSSNITSTMLNNMNSDPDAINLADGTLASPVTYSFSSSALSLTHSGNQVNLASGVSFPSNFWGINSGCLVDASTLASMQASSAAVHEACNQSTYYTWSIGKDNWSKYTALKDSSGKIVTFDAPIEVPYKHSKEYHLGGSTSFIDKKFVLTFDNGHLSIPSSQDSDSGYWKSEFAIGAGAKSENGKYKLKPLEGQVILGKTDESKCSDLDVSNPPELPALDRFDPAQANSDAEPDTSKLSPIVVKGEYKG